MRRSTLMIFTFGALLGIAVGITFEPLVSSDDDRKVAIWLEVVHRVLTGIGGLGTFVALVVVLRQFYLLRTQSELVQKNVIASIDAQLYARLDSFNRFVFEHSREYDLLDQSYHQIESQEQRSKLHRMCELGFTFFEEIFKHHTRLQLLDGEDWEKWEQNLLHFFQKPYVHGYWRSVSTRYTRSFQHIVNGYVTAMEASAPPKA